MNLYEIAHSYNELYPGFGMYSGLPSERDLAQAMGDCIRLAASADIPANPTAEQIYLRGVLTEVNKLAPASAGFFFHHIVENPQLHGTSRALEFMLAAMSERSPETFEHIKHHTALAMRFYEQRYGVPKSAEEVSTLLTMMLAAMGHDIGKEAIDPRLLHQSTRIAPARLEEALSQFAQRVPDYPEKLQDLQFLKQANEGKIIFATAEELQTAQGPVSHQVNAQGWSRSESYLTSIMQRAEHNAIFSRIDALAQEYMPNAWLSVEEKTRLKGAYRGTLTPVEAQIVNTHDKMSESFFAQLELPPFLASVKEIVSMDRFRQADKNAPISELADIIHLTDVFEALTANRSYRGPLPVDMAFNIMQGMAAEGQLSMPLLQEFANRGTAQEFAAVTGRAISSVPVQPMLSTTWASRPDIASRAPQASNMGFAQTVRTNNLGMGTPPLP